jgi:hypothetical protein
MINVIRFAKIILLVAGICWAVFATQGLMFLARTFPTPGPVVNSPTRILADAQGYALVYGPAVIALVLLFVRWPARPRSR